MNNELSTIRMANQDKATMREMKAELEKSFTLIRAEQQSNVTEVRFELEEAKKDLRKTKMSFDKDWVNSMVDLSWFDEAVNDIKSSSSDSHRAMRKIQEELNIKSIEQERGANETNLALQEMKEKLGEGAMKMKEVHEANLRQADNFDEKLMKFNQEMFKKV